ncbi:hypothetical protein P5G51_018315 [Virgibacillus sp. 179-BFC.A HS]|uniref:Uncharacterized protein n=1 Tax=Tigheibacillus jepli TaxID=3035914 RepID=A0ABU5CNK7_9BACI|nr:hypothetical protein [Virgibacillus sp. 179-BFC.A HS]MDY0407033.1 hypothetical protein [Virgibacillus sp. 179-BFC.A HS]
MDTVVKLADIVKGMKLHAEKSLPFLNKNTGAVVYSSSAFLLDAKGEDSAGELFDWQLREMELAYDIVERPDKYVEIPPLPEQEWKKEFCLMQGATGEKLLPLVADKKAFDDALEAKGLAESWHDFLNEKAEEAAIAFCQKLGLEYEKI